MKKYGVKLVLYRGQKFDMWVYDEGRFETDDEQKAQEVADQYKSKNPFGCYCVEEIKD